jgi:hypothetical protein
MKYGCAVCLAMKKVKFFPKLQPYQDRHICENCINKNLRNNNIMVANLEKQIERKLTKDERLNIELSFKSVMEIKEVSKTDKNARVLKDLCGCTDVEVATEALSKLGLSTSVVNELAIHFTTVARLRSQADGSNQVEAIHEEEPTTNIDDELQQLSSMV